MVDSAREVCGSVRMEGKNPKNVWWNDVVKDAVERKEAAWRSVKKKRERLKGLFIRAKRINSLGGR